MRIKYTCHVAGYGVSKLFAEEPLATATLPAPDGFAAPYPQEVAKGAPLHCSDPIALSGSVLPLNYFQIYKTIPLRLLITY